MATTLRDYETQAVLLAASPFPKAQEAASAIRHLCRALEDAGERLTSRAGCMMGSSTGRGGADELLYDNEEE